MRCSGCAAENAPDCRFCSECGARLVSICPSCRFENAPAAKFCGGCGARLTGAAAPAVTQPAPESYTPKPLAERILRSRGALEGERKQVTVLFADIKGSMELIQSADPEDARRILDPTIEAMMRAVHRYEGTVNKVLGDGIMALFGAPIAHEDHAVRACYAALAIQNALREIAEKIRRDFGVEVQVRTGLHSGEVVVRTIGNDLTMDYDAIGQTTHLASRMEQLALPGSIRMTADTLRLAEGFSAGSPARPDPGEGAGTANRSLRADRRGRRALAPASFCGRRLHSFRRPRARDARARALRPHRRRQRLYHRGTLSAHPRRAQLPRTLHPRLASLRPGKAQGQRARCQASPLPPLPTAAARLLNLSDLPEAVRTRLCAAAANV